MLQPPSGTVTFLFTDIERSTQLWESAPEAMRPALERHDALLRAAIDAHDGYVVKTTGDGVHAAFARAGDALTTAVANGGQVVCSQSTIAYVLTELDATAADGV